MSDEDPAMMQHFRVTDPDFVRFLSCFNREEDITDRPSIAGSSPAEAAVEAHSPKYEADKRPVEISLNHPSSTMSDEDPATFPRYRPRFRPLTARSGQGE
jgi:hypothetical protein